MKLKVDCKDLKSTKANLLIKTENGLDTLASYSNFDGYVEIEQNVENSKFVYLALENLPYIYGFVMEQGEYDLKVSSDLQLIYKGGPWQQKFDSIFLDEKLKSLKVIIYKLSKEREIYTGSVDEFKKKYSTACGNSNKRYYELNDSLRSLDPLHALFFSYKNNDLGENAEETLKLINKLDKDIYAKEIGYWNSIYKRIQHLQAISKRLDIGQKFYDFSFTDKNDHVVDFAKIIKENKLVLVEFWASWCGPCRGEFPYLKKDYERFHKTGFDIISISIDKEELAWSKALEKENLSWYNVRDKKEFATKCGVSGIPANWLVNSKGVIVARDLRGDEVKEFLDANL